MAGTLYLVPTPIGNLGDISPRAQQALRKADFIAAEDTRVTVKLLNHLEIKKQMVPYHRHNFETAGPAILARLEEGAVCALVTDAGTPAISDPGEDLVVLCAERGISVIPIPGPCALIAALSASALPTGRFTFEGFLPMNRKNRRAQLDSLRGETRTMVFYEAPHKLRATLEDLEAAFGSERRISLCRELTKLHEEILRTTLAQARAHYEACEPRGEFVLVVEGAEEQAVQRPVEEALERVGQLRRQGASLKDAAGTAAAEFGLRRRELYDLALGKTSGTPQ